MCATTVLTPVLLILRGPLAMVDYGHIDATVRCFKLLTTLSCNFDANLVQTKIGIWLPAIALPARQWARADMGWR